MCGTWFEVWYCRQAPKWRTVYYLRKLSRLPNFEHEFHFESTLIFWSRVSSVTWISCCSGISSVTWIYCCSSVTWISYCSRVSSGSRVLLQSHINILVKSLLGHRAIGNQFYIIAWLRYLQRITARIARARIFSPRVRASSIVTKNIPRSVKMFALSGHPF